MKKTVSVNLNGRVFNIDEDAYELLSKYLTNLRIYFRKEEGADEIITDFEARIEELFSEHIRQGYEVITIEFTENVIKQVGKPEDFEQETEMGNQGINNEQNTQQNQKTENPKTRKKLYRNPDDKLLGGVCSGLAAYLGWDVIWVRLAVIILTFAGVGWTIPVYIVMWAIMPQADTAEQKLEMKGEEVTLENIGKVVSSSINDITNKVKDKNFSNTLVDIIVAFVKVGVVLLGLLVAGPLLFALFILLVVLFSVAFGLTGGLASLPLNIFGVDLFNIVGGSYLALIALILVIGIPVFTIIYSIIAYFGKLKPVNRIIKITASIVWITALITLAALNINNFKNNGWRVYNSETGINRGRNKGEKLRGNGILSNRIEELPTFNVFVANSYFNNLEIEQDTTGKYQIEIDGESNIIDKIEYRVVNDKLYLEFKSGYRYINISSINIKLKVPTLQGVEMIGASKLNINRLVVDNLYVETEGASSFTADSLVCNSFNAEVKGASSMTIKGTANNAEFEVKGAAKINALDFEAKNVKAEVKGAGFVKCNPISMLYASVEGVGKITYKNEPVQKNINIEGLGKISKN